MGHVRVTAMECELGAEDVSDARLAEQFDCTEDSVAGLSRGRLRAHSPDGEGPANLAARAATRLLDKRGLDANDVDFIVFCTNTPDLHFPGSGCILQDLLEGEPVGAVDMRAQCAGFVAGLDAARRLVMGGMYERVLLAVGDVSSHFNPYEGERYELAALMGDGAAVALIEAGGEADDVLAAVFHTDGTRHRDYWCECAASRRGPGDDMIAGARITREDIVAGAHFPHVDFVAMRETATSRVPEVFAEVLDVAGLAGVDATLIAHLLPEVEEELAAALGAAAGTVLTPDFLYTGGATLPMLLARARGQGRLDGASTVAMLTAGAGATWAGAVMRIAS